MFELFYNCEGEMVRVKKGSINTLQTRSNVYSEKKS